MPIYDTCDEIVSTIVLTKISRELTRNPFQRRKIGLHLRKDGVTQAQFMRDLSAQFHTQTVKIQSNSLNTFRGQKGATAGSRSNVFYAAYCFFEKIRIKEKKAKSEDRLDMEDIYGVNGVPRDIAPNQKYICSAWSYVYEDRYGQIRTGRC